MSPTESQVTGIEQLAIVIQQGKGKAETTLGKFVKMLLSYQHGLDVETVTDPSLISKVLHDNSGSIHSVYLIQDQPVSTQSTVPVLSAQGTIPLFLIVPGHIANELRESCAGLEGVHICQWEMAFSKGEESLPQIVASGIEVEGDSDTDTTDLEEKIRSRLERLDTLPTLPAVVVHIMELIKDPTSTAAELEVLLASDPAIVLKVMQVANSAAFAGSGHRGGGTLQDAVVRLGNRKVGAIAQQIALINSFVRPEDSEFDMRRFWEHSLACAVVADRLCGEGYAVTADEVTFNDYWIAGLLHDAGKLVQGLFFWEWFERVLRMMDSDRCSFYEAEIELMGGMVSHDFIGELLLQKARMPTELIEAVGFHHSPGDSPSSLVSLIHVSNNLCKEIGLGFTENESAAYSSPALSALQLSEESIGELKDEMGESVVNEVKELVKQSMQG